MVDNENDIFDRKIKDILGNASEEVPEHVWASIEKRLKNGEAVSGGRKINLPSWIKAGIAVTAAAAAALIVFFTATNDSVTDADGGRLVADSGYPEKIGMTDSDAFPEQMLSESMEWNAEPVAAESYPGSAPEAIRQAAMTQNPDDEDGAGHEASGEDTETAQFLHENTPVTENTGSPDATGTTEKRKGSGDKEVSEDIWSGYDFTDEKPRERPRASITLSGNAISNTNSTVSREPSNQIAHRPATTDQMRNKVTESSESSFGIPLSFGIGAKVDFTPRWSISAGINYTLLTRTFAGNYYQVTDNQEYKGTFFSDIHNGQSYIGIPVNVYYNILKGDFIDFYVYAGGTAEKCILDRYNMKAEGISITHRETVKGLQFSANVGMGMEFVIANQFGIYIDPSLRYYFSNGNQPRSIRTMQPLMFGLEMGFRIRL